VLLGVGAEHLEKSNDLSSKVDVEVCSIHIQKVPKLFVHFRLKLPSWISPKQIPPFVSTDWCISCAQTQKE
jgi:hypothetical protein